MRADVRGRSCMLLWARGRAEAVTGGGQDTSPRAWAAWYVDGRRTVCGRGSDPDTHAWRNTTRVRVAARVGPLRPASPRACASARPPGPAEQMRRPFLAAAQPAPTTPNSHCSLHLARQGISQQTCLSPSHPGCCRAARSGRLSSSRSILTRFGRSRGWPASAGESIGCSTHASSPHTRQ